MRRPDRTSVALAVLSCLALATAPSGASTPVLSGEDSPDGDPAFRTLEFPAAEHPLDGPARPGRALDADFVLTGELPEGDTPSGVAFTPDGARIVVAHRDSQNLIVFDAARRTFLLAIPLSGSPNGVAVSPDGSRAVTANVFEDTASIVDLGAGTEIAVVPVGDQPGVVRITPDGTLAAVGNTVSGSISVIDVAAATELREIAGTGFLTSLSISFESGARPSSFSQFELADNTTLVHPDFYADEIDLVDITTGAVTSLPCDGDPRGVAVTPDGSTAVVAHTGSVQRVSVVDVGGATITKTIPTGIDLFGGHVAVDPVGAKAVVSVLNACRVVNLATNGVSGNLNTASVNAILTTADGTHAMTVGFRGSLISYASESVVTELNNVVSTAVGAVSPTAPLGVMVANVFGEDMVVVSTNGAGGSLQGVVPSGPPPEGDKARVAALSADGSKAVVSSILSDNATIVDVPGRSVEAIVDVGDRPSEVEITPDGTKAVVANLDSNFASVIDLGTYDVTNITISRRAGQVEISPDGTYAYLAVVADGDGVWRIDLNTLSVAGPKRLTGNMGGVLYAFNQSSGLTLSHDGATLVTCNSFDDTITVLDTAAWSVIATVPVGDFPTRAVFSADDSEMYVANRDGDTITVVGNTPGFPVTGTVAVGQQPYEMVVNAAGTELWVSNFQDSNVGVVDLASGVMLRTTPVPNAPAGLGYDGTRNELYVASGTWSVTLGPGPVFSFAQAGELSVIDAVSGSVTDQLDTGLPPAMLAYVPSTGTIAVPSPLGDGLSLVEAGGPVAVGEGVPEAGLRLAPPSPNPTRAAADLRFSAPGGLPVSLGVFDVSGRRVARLADGVVAAGAHRVRWDGRDARGAPVAPGVYWVRLEAGSRSESRRLVVVR